MVSTMRYDDMREHVRDHFYQLLRAFREKAAASGPVTGVGLAALRSSESPAQDDADNWASMIHAEETAGLLREFCAARGISQVPEGRERDLLLAELQKGYREYISRALAQTQEYDTLVLEQEPLRTTPVARIQDRKAVTQVQELSFDDVVIRHFDELERTNALVAKTKSEKRDAISLLSALTDAKPLGLMTKSDAQEVKAALFKLPKNRSKNPKTRNLPLSKALEIEGVERIAARTLNVYLGHMQSLFTWAVNNGYAAENVFSGLKVKTKKGGTDDGRKAFTSAQLRLMYSHLTETQSPLVRKDSHKWPALIAMFTGMRLNEVAQLEVTDVGMNEDVWCINVTPDGGDNKRLKNASSKRIVPVHARLMEAGFLDFYEMQRASGHVRLFPDLTYSAQNGYGRNAGRWFNERFLHEIGLGGQGLVFHCLRHTMVTRLAQSGVEEAQLKALVGHSQSGVTFSTYFKDGFLPSQLREAINRFDF